MKLTVEPDTEVPQVDSRGEALGTGRSPGIHLGAALKRLRKAWGMKTDGIEGEQDGLRMFAGFVLEKALEIAFKWLFQRVRPVISGIEHFVDGVYMTPDGFNHEDGRLEEYKLSWTSMKNFEADPLDRKKSHPDWLVQIMAYCRAYGVRQARLIVFWVNGDYTYKPGHGPQLKSYLFDFDDDEIEHAWKLVLAEVADMRREGVA